MNTIFDMMQNFVERGMNVRVDVAAGAPMLSALPLEQETGVEAAALQSQKKSEAAACCA